MVGRLSGKRAFLLGAATGIGAATAKAFLAAGTKVMIADINDPAASALARDLGAVAGSARCDAGSEEQVAVDCAEKRRGGLDTVVRFAGKVRRCGSDVRFSCIRRIRVY